jgi:hypothetical protein
VTGRTAAVGLALCAALAASPASRAATIVYDLAGTTDNWRSTLAANPSGIFTNFVAPGSSLTLDFDANADGVAGDVTIVSGQIVLQYTDNLFVSPFSYGSLTFNTVAQLSGGHGQVRRGLPADYSDFIDWDTGASYSITGTVTCLGAICSLFGSSGKPEGVPFPYADYEQFQEAIGMDLQTELQTFTWAMDPNTFASLGYFCLQGVGSTGPGCYGSYVLRSPFYTGFASDGSAATWLNFEMHAVPEPAAFASLGVALALFAFRRLRE